MLPPPGVRKLLLPLAAGIELAVGAIAAALAVAGLLASADRHRRITRVATLTGGYLVVELLTLARLGVTWALRPGRSPEWYDRANLTSVEWAVNTMVAVARRSVGFTIEIEGPAPAAAPDAATTPDPLLMPGPVLVLARHGGLGDSLAVLWLVIRHGRRPKVVLKEALAWDPLVDVALSRVGACFLRSGSPDRVTQIATLAQGLEPRDALVVFPEGGNWTPRRRWLAVRHLIRGGHRREARAALLMNHVLPPRPAGVLACLDARPDLATVVVAHAGMDGLHNPGAVWRALPFGRPLTLRWWPTTPPPEGEEERLAWLTAEWAVVDEWVDARTSGPPPVPSSVPPPPTSPQYGVP